MECESGGAEGMRSLHRSLFWEALLPFKSKPEHATQIALALKVTICYLPASKSKRLKSSRTSMSSILRQDSEICANIYIKVQKETICTDLQRAAGAEGEQKNP